MSCVWVSVVVDNSNLTDWILFVKEKGKVFLGWYGYVKFFI